MIDAEIKSVISNGAKDCKNGKSAGKIILICNSRIR